MSDKGKGQPNVSIGTTAERIRARRKQQQGKKLSAAEKLLLRGGTGKGQKNAAKAVSRGRSGKREKFAGFLNRLAGASDK